MNFKKFNLLKNTKYQINEKVIKIKHRNCKSNLILQNL